MNRASSLHRLQSWALLRFEELHQLASPLSLPLSKRDQERLGHVAIEATNTWAALMRSYWLCAASPGWRQDGSRVRLSTPLGSHDRAMTFAVHRFRPSLRGQSGPWSPRDEPDWLDPATVSTLLHDSGADIEGGFQAAVSLGGTARQDLLTYRNFVAHRNRATALKVRRLCPDLTRAGSIDPLEIGLQHGRGRPQGLVLDWLDDLRTMCALLPT